MTQAIRTIRIATQGPAGPAGPTTPDAVLSVAGRTGAVTLSAGDVSGLAASATTDATNAGNIGSGTLSNARLSGVTLNANNLSDIADAAAARTNLGLGALATLGVGSGLASGGGNLSADVTSVAARTGAVTLAQADIAGLTTASAPTFAGASLNGGTVTASTPLQADTQTWNNAGVTFVGRTSNITDTASAAGSLLERWQVGGVDKISIRKDGSLLLPSTGGAGLFFGTGPGASFAANGSTLLFFGVSGTNQCVLTPSELAIFSAASYAWVNPGGSIDTWLSGAKSPATIMLGQANSATPVAQTLMAQGSRVGTDTNVAGGNLTIKPGVGTGNATPSALIFNSWVAVGSGSGTQTDTETLRLQGGVATLGGPLALKSYTVATLPTGSAGMMAFASDLRVFNGAGIQEGAGAGSGGAVCHNGSAWKIAGTNVTAMA